MSSLEVRTTKGTYTPPYMAKKESLILLPPLRLTFVESYLKVITFRTWY